MVTKGTRYFHSTTLQKFLTAEQMQKLEEEYEKNRPQPYVNDRFQRLEKSVTEEELALLKEYFDTSILETKGIAEKHGTSSVALANTVYSIAIRYIYQNREKLGL
jgi:Mg2+ and Co2+ transporter CorA